MLHTSMFVARASRAFSTSSLTAVARSTTTCPLEILWMTSCDTCLIRCDISQHYMTGDCVALPLLDAGVCKHAGYLLVTIKSLVRALSVQERPHDSTRYRRNQGRTASTDIPEIRIEMLLASMASERPRASGDLPITSPFPLFPTRLYTAVNGTTRSGSTHVALGADYTHVKECQWSFM